MLLPELLRSLNSSSALQLQERQKDTYLYFYVSQLNNALVVRGKKWYKEFGF